MLRVVFSVKRALHARYRENDHRIGLGPPHLGAPSPIGAKPSELHRGFTKGIALVKADCNSNGRFRCKERPVFAIPRKRPTR